MKISAKNIGKRFSRFWVIRHVHTTLEGPGHYALLGKNGSGKSTLLRILAGMQVPSAGQCEWELNGQVLSPDKRYAYTSFSAPGMSLPDELSLKEFLDFHFQFKDPAPGLRRDDILDMMGLTSFAHRSLDAFSSGMLQRVKLAQALFSDTPFVFLDEPCTNLDDQGVKQYREWVETWTKNRLVLIASNDPREYDFCPHQLQVRDLESRP